MTAPTTLQLGMSLDDYLQRYSDEGRFEIINGVAEFMSPNVSGHSHLVRTLFLALYQALVGNSEWEVFQETAFAEISPDNPNWVKGALEPDVMVLSKSQWAAVKASTPGWQNGPVTIVPTLVIEVVSLTDRYTVIMDKIAQYFSLGVSVVWLVDARHATVSVYRGTLQPEVLSGAKALTAKDILPNFELSVEKLFELL
jgi:Uma2 family endonuclease